MKKHEVIIIGGGPGGSTLLSYLAMKGIDAAVIEREVFPRFHIGESLLPFSMDVFREIGVYGTLDSGKYIRKFGAQFMHHQQDEEVYFDFEGGLDSNHGMAFEVPRDQFDDDLLQHAKKLGGRVYQPEMVKEVEFFDSHVRVTTNKDQYEAKFVADVTGRAAMFGKKYKLRQPNTDFNNVGVFAHFTGVERLPDKRAGDICIGLLEDLKWCWLIPFQGDRTSVGVVCSSKILKQEGGFDDYIESAVRCSRQLAERMRSAERVTEVGVISNYSHSCETLAGPRWIMVGDAATFLDPIFSSGVHVAVSTARMASEALADALKANCLLTERGLKENYESKVQIGTDRFRSLIKLFYDTNFVSQMKKTFSLKHMRAAFTSVVAGDVWNDENPIFRTKVL